MAELSGTPMPWYQCRRSPHLFFLFRSPNLGKTMLDFRPRLFTILPFFDLVDFDGWSTSIAAGVEHEISSKVKTGGA